MIRQYAGFTIIELMISIAILAVLTSMAIPYYQNYRDQINVNQAETDILSIEVLIEHFHIDNHSYPMTLSDVDVGTKLDPWGNPYEYLNISSVNGKGNLRRDKSLNPINSDYDLYSMGKDGQTKMPVTAKESHDDIIRARDGKFVGLASDF